GRGRTVLHRDGEALRADVGGPRGLRVDDLQHHLRGAADVPREERRGLELAAAERATPWQRLSLAQHVGEQRRGAGTEDVLRSLTNGTVRAVRPFALHRADARGWRCHARREGDDGVAQRIAVDHLEASPFEERRVLSREQYVE